MTVSPVGSGEGTISNLADEIRTWHLKNYPNATDSQALMAVGEEFGELDRAELKQAGGIRGSWDHWQTEKAKEIGDVLIALINFAVGIDKKATVVRAFGDLEKKLTNYRNHVPKAEQALHATAKCIGEMREQFVYAPSWRQLDTCLYYTIIELNGYAQQVSLDIVACLEQRWATIKLRDYEANPFDGGRENEA